MTNSVLQIRPPHHFADTAAVRRPRLAIGQLGIDVGLRLNPPQRATRVVGPLEQALAGGIGHAHNNGSSSVAGAAGEHRASRRSGQQVADRVTDDGAVSVASDTRSPTTRRRGADSATPHRHHHHRQADCHTQQQTRHYQHRAVTGLRRAGRTLRSRRREGTTDFLRRSRWRGCAAKALAIWPSTAVVVSNSLFSSGEFRNSLNGNTSRDGGKVGHP